MLKKILSVSGKPGLYQLVSSGKNMLIVESLTDKKKLPIHARDKVVSLGDISIYTEEDDTPLKDVLVAIKTKEAGAKVTLASTKPEDLKKYLGEVLPTFDRERVYPTDIKKLISWYNILVDANVDFETEEKLEGEEAVVEEAAAPKKAASPKAPKATKTASPKASSASKGSAKTSMPRKAQ